MKEIISRIDSLFQEKSRIIIAIDGKCASGKSTLANKLQQIYNANLFAMDDFFLPPGLRTAERLSQPGGNVHYERFKEQILDMLFFDIDFTYQIYNCETDELTASSLIRPNKLNIVEGSYSMHPQLKHAYDLTICLTVNEETQRERILSRNGASALDMFVSRWIPLENEYIEKTDLFNACDLLIK